MGGGGFNQRRGVLVVESVGEGELNQWGGGGVISGRGGRELNQWRTKELNQWGEGGEGSWIRREGEERVESSEICRRG